MSVVITVCSSTLWGSPWVEQAGPRDGRREGVTERPERIKVISE